MNRRSILGLALALPAVAAVKAKAEAGPKTYFVLMHSPGPGWDKARSFRDQPGIGAHVAYMSGFADQKKLVMGGPFLDDSGGMMVFDLPDLKAARAVATADPTVKSGLLKVRVKPWLVAITRD
jgi:uncharacterized protein YciI